jgi:hypothetical protein
VIEKAALTSDDYLTPGAKFEARSMQMQLLAASIGFSACGIGKDMVVPPSPLLLTDVVHQPLRLHENRSYNTPHCLPTAELSALHRLTRSRAQSGSSGNSCDFCTNEKPGVKSMSSLVKKSAK